MDRKYMGENNPNYRHGKCRTKIYDLWSNMKARCSENYKGRRKHYVDKGISVCEEWNYSFETFYEWAMNNGYKEGLEIDRKDSDGNYCPDNCQFLDRKNHVKKDLRILDKETADEICNIYWTSHVLQKELAHRYGVSQQTISNIVRNSYE